MQNIKERDECIKKLITNEEYEKYSKVIIENNKKLMLKNNI